MEMPTPREFRARLAALFAALLLAVIPAAASSTATASSPAAASSKDSQDAARFLESFGARAIATLGDKSMTSEQREASFRQLLSEGFALKAIGRFVMGKHWKRATAEQKRDFAVLFEDFVVRSYLRKLSNYAGEALSIGRTRFNESKGLASISSRIERSGATPVAVEWRLHARSGHWQIYDVVVEGVSMAMSQRSEFDAVIRGNGGQIQELLRHLREMTQV